MITLKDTDSGMLVKEKPDLQSNWDTWVVNMTERVLPGDCQPTPTPKIEDCCDGLGTSTDVTEGGTIILNNNVSKVMQVAGTLLQKNYLNQPVEQMLRIVVQLKLTISH